MRQSLIPGSHLTRHPGQELLLWRDSDDYRGTLESMPFPRDFDGRQSAMQFQLAAPTRIHVFICFG